MRLLAFANTLEALENYLDAFRLCQARGDSVEILFLQPAGRTVAPFGADVPLRVIADGVGPSSPKGGNSALETIAQSLVGEDPDVLFLCDPDQPAARELTALVRKHAYRGIMIGGQAGFGGMPPRELGVDRLLCFGVRGLSRLRPEHRASAYATGLPRLDRLREVVPTAGGYGLFLAHRSPEAPVIDATLAAFEKHARMPMVVLDHPDHPGVYRFKSTSLRPEFLNSSRLWKPEQWLQNCSFVLAGDATAVLEALYLKKPVVLLPCAGLTAWDGYPGISEGFSPGAIAAAAQRVAQNPELVDEFLRQAVGGVRFNHADSVALALSRLVRSGPLRSIDYPSEKIKAVELTGPVLPVLSTRVELASFVPPGGQAAELGVALGAFSDELLRSREDFRLISIDRWGGDRGHDDSEYEAACRRLRVHGERCRILRRSFEEALTEIAPESLDLIYIDGYAHDGQEGGRTLEAWWSRLKPGGVFSGHDYHPDWKPTKEAVDRFCAAHGLGLQITQGDYFPSWYVRKMREA